MMAASFVILGPMSLTPVALGIGFSQYFWGKAFCLWTCIHFRDFVIFVQISLEINSHVSLDFHVLSPIKFQLCFTCLLKKNVYLRETVREHIGWGGPEVRGKGERVNLKQSLC